MDYQLCGSINGILKRLLALVAGLLIGGSIHYFL